MRPIRYVAALLLYPTLLVSVTVGDDATESPVTKVAVDDDLSHATVFVSVMPAEHGELTMHGLRAAAKRIRSEVGKVIRIRRTPRLTFRLDDSIKRHSSLEQSLKE